MGGWAKAHLSVFKERMVFMETTEVLNPIQVDYLGKGLWGVVSGEIIVGGKHVFSPMEDLLTLVQTIEKYLEDTKLDKLFFIELSPMADFLLFEEYSW